jgi:WD40 repeat protein
MKKLLLFCLFLFLIPVLLACSQSQAVQSPQSTSINPAYANTTVPISTAQPTPTISLPVLAGTPLPKTEEKIGADNLDKFEQFARWGNGFIRQASWSPNGSILAMAGQDGIFFYDTNDYKEIRVIDGWYETIAFSPDQNILAVPKSETIKLYDLTTGENVRTLERHTSDVIAITFSQDGKIRAY